MNNQEYSQQQIEALIPAYGMGMTSVDESRQVEAFLRDNPTLQNEVDSYRELASHILEDLPQIEPPASLLGQILQAAEIHAPKPILEVTPAQSRTFGARNRWFLSAVAGFIAVLGFVAMMYTDLREQIESLSAQATMQAEILRSAGRDQLVEFRLVSTDSEDERRGGRVLCHPDQHGGVVHTWQFPPLEADQVYQVWLTRGEERDSGGTFRVDEEGRSDFVLNAPKPMGEYSYIGITIEPEGGSETPTSNPVARASLYALRGSNAEDA